MSWLPDLVNVPSNDTIDDVDSDTLKAPVISMFKDDLAEQSTLSEDKIVNSNLYKNKQMNRVYLFDDEEYRQQLSPKGKHFEWVCLMIINYIHTHLYFNYYLRT